MNFFSLGMQVQTKIWNTEFELQSFKLYNQVLL
jgi:hypothetical protein